MGNRKEEVVFDYETPVAERPRQTGSQLFSFIEWAFQKLLFAGGLALLAEGVGNAMRGQFSASNAPDDMAWGAFLAGLAIPITRWGKN